MLIGIFFKAPTPSWIATLPDSKETLATCCAAASAVSSADLFFFSQLMLFILSVKFPVTSDLSNPSYIGDA